MKLNATQRMQAYRVLMGEALCEKRKEKGLSQQNIADLVGISRVSVSYYENGIRSINTDELLSLCDICGFDALEIMNHAYNASDIELSTAYKKYLERSPE